MGLAVLFCFKPQSDTFSFTADAMEPKSRGLFMVSAEVYGWLRLEKLKLMT